MIEFAWNGKTITNPGLYRDIDISRYHEVINGKHVPLCDGPSISSTGLRTIANEDPEHFYAGWAGNPNRVERTEKEHFVIGRAVHHLLLGQSFFAKEFIIRPDELMDPKTGEMKPWQGNRTVCKEWMERAQASGRAVLSGEMVENIKGMSIKLGRHPLVRAGILNGKVERSLIWKDKETGIWLKARPDAIPTDSGDFTDFKSTISVQWLDLMRTLEDFSYHQQAALVREGAREVLGMEMSTFTLLFQEKKNPWSVRDVRLKDNDLDRGQKQNRAALRTFWRCLKNNEWPGPGAGAEGTEYLELSARAQERIDEQLKQQEQGA